jgi:release factor glutamine methyltransferase
MVEPSQRTEKLTVMDVVYRTTAFFKEKLGPVSERPRIDAEILIASALGLSRLQLHLKHDQPLSDEELSRCRGHVSRRAKGEPIAYITGQKEFYGLAFDVKPGVLVPRPETEDLVTRALEVAKQKGPGCRSFRWLELGSGSGCVSVALGCELKAQGIEPAGVAVDISPVARELTRRNWLKHDSPGELVILDAPAEDLTRAHVPDVNFDVILANPPYIKNGDPDVAADVRQHEPAIALFSGPLGTELIEAWLMTAKTIVESPTPFVFEMGHGQGQWARDNLTPSRGVLDLAVHQDLAGLDRYITGRLVGVAGQVEHSVER